MSTLQVDSLLDREGNPFDFKGTGNSIVVTDPITQLTLELKEWAERILFPGDSIVTATGGNIPRSLQDWFDLFETGTFSLTIYESAEAGRAEVADGDFYFVASSDANSSKEIWRRVDASTSEFISADPSRGYVDLAVDTANEAKTAAESSSIRKMPRAPRNNSDFYTAVGGKSVHFGSFLKLPRAEGREYTSLVAMGDRVFMSDAGGAVVDPDEPEVVEKEEAFSFYTPERADASAYAVQPVGGESHIFRYAPGASGSQISPAGSDWSSPSPTPGGTVKALRTSTPAGPVTLTEGGHVIAHDNVVYHKLITGQSLSLGSRGFVLDNDADHEIAPGRFGYIFTQFLPATVGEYCITLEGGPRPDSPSGSTTFEPMRETIDNTILGETIASGWAVGMHLWDKSRVGMQSQFLASVSGFGGQPYSSLKKGTPTYNNALAQITNANNIATGLGKDHFVGSIAILHGESETPATDTGYEAILGEWISDYQTDIAAITGQSVPPILFISQTNTGEAGALPGVAQGQLLAGVNNPDVTLIGPKYQYPYFDTYHMQAEGYIKVGEQESKAEQCMLRGDKWMPLYPVSITAVGPVITIQTNVDVAGDVHTPGPLGGLTIDVDTITDPGNYGFVLSSGTISTIEISEDHTAVIITTTSDVTSGTTLSYAMQASGYNQPADGRRGNIRDMDPRTVSRFDNKTVYNWMVAFDQTITLA